MVGGSRGGWIEGRGELPESAKQVVKEFRIQDDRRTNSCEIEYLLKEDVIQKMAQEDVIAAKDCIKLQRWDVSEVARDEFNM